MPVDPVPPATPTPSVVAVQAESLPPLPAMFALSYSSCDEGAYAILKCYRYGSDDGLKKQLYTADQMRAYLLADRASRSQAEAAREGWVTVPREPTEAMQKAAELAYRMWSDAEVAYSEFKHSDSYRAMIAAAPLVSAGDEGQVK